MKIGTTISNIFRRGKNILRQIFRKKERPTREKGSLAMHQVMRARKARVVPTASQIKLFPRLLSNTEKRLAILAVVAIIVTGSILFWQLLNSQRTEQPIVGGEYTEGLIGAPQLINPLYSLTSDVDTDLSRLIYSGLMRYDVKNGLVLDLAEKYEVNDDQTVYTFTLRDDAQWHDGRNVRASDIVFTISAIQNPEYRSPLEVSFSGVAVEQVNERTVRFTLKEPFAPFLSLMTVGILPSHVWQDIAPANAPLAEQNKKPIGSGPYQFDKLVKDGKGNIRSYTLKRNSHYHLGAPYVEKLNFKFYSDISAALEALKNHNIEGLSYLPLEAVPNFKNENNLQLIFPDLRQYTAAFLNQKHNELLENDEVRQALAQATDKQQLVQVVLEGYGRPADSFILGGMLGEHPDLETIDFNLEGAKATLEEAGWVFEEGADVRSKDGTTLDLTIVTLDSPELVACANVLQEQWSLAGFRIAVSAVENAEFQNNILKNRNYDVLISGELYGIDTDPYAFWHSSQTEFPGLNLSQFSNRSADELIEKARSSSDLDERAQAYIELQDIVAESIPAIFLYQPQYSFVAAARIQNLNVKQIVVPADRFSNVHNWYIKTKKIIGDKNND